MPQLHIKACIATSVCMGNIQNIQTRVREVPLKYGVHVLRKMESQSFFSESSVCVRVMKRQVPCTLWHIKKGVPLCEN